MKTKSGGYHSFDMLLEGANKVIQMEIKEKDIINFSMRAEVGVRRYYNKEVFCKEGQLFVNVGDKDVPVSEIFHIEIIGSMGNEPCREI